jgi:DNA-binding transcriptional ArsR family regulator
VATSGQLVEAVSEATDFAAETVVVHMRNLREAGLVDIRGRGRSAAKMTARDAARLLMAVSGTIHVKESVGAVLSFKELSAYRRELVSPKEQTTPVTIVPHRIDGPRHWSVGRPLIPGLNGEEVRKRFGLGRVKLGTTFEEALITVIEGTLADTLFPPLQSSDFRKPTSKIANYKKRLWVTLYRPEAYASITYLAEGITYEKVLFQKKPDVANATYRDTAARRKRTAVLYRQSDFNEQALEIVCDALRA